MATLLGRKKGYPVANYEWDGRRLIRTYDDMYLVQAASENEGPTTIILSLGIPIGDPFFDDAFAYAKRVGPVKRSVENRLFWEVPVFYTSQFPQPDIDDLPKRPDERRLRRRWSFETLQVAMTKDPITGDPFVNSVNEPFEVTEDITIPVLTVERYEEGFAAQTILDYVNHVNASAFYGAPAKTALMAGISAEEDAAEVFEGVLFDRVQYTIKFKLPVTEENKGWLLRIIDMGTQHKDDATDKLIPYLGDPDRTTGKAEKITGPLDGNGYRLPEGSDLYVLPDGTGFNKHETAEFDTLLIGPND